MTFKKYLKDNLNNCLINKEPIDFEKFYKEYTDFKKIGKNIIKEYKINKIIIKDNKMIIPDRFIENDIPETDSLICFIHDKISSNVDLAILSNIVSSALERCYYDYKYYGKNAEDIDLAYNFKELINSDKGIITYTLFKEVLSDGINEFGSNHKLNNVEEVLKPYEELFANWLNFNDNYSAYFHSLKVEIIFYTSELYYGTTPVKKCKSCGEPFKSNSYLCEKCNKKRKEKHNNERNKANQKCRRLREKLSIYVDEYRDDISVDLKNRTERMLEEEHKHTDLKELIRLKEAIEKELNV
jgi:hypothetical protein